jgi:hypothetical protein
LTVLTFLVVPVFYTFMEGLAGLLKRFASLFKKRSSHEQRSLAEEGIR